VGHLEKALAIQPNYASPYKNLGDALFQMGQADNAITHFQKALALRPNYADAHNSLGNALFQTGQVDEAIAHFQQALKLQPNLGSAHNNLANALLRKGQVDEAIAHFQLALKIQPAFAEAHNNLANALLQMGRFEEAVAHYQAAVVALPGHPYLLNNLALVLATCPKASVRNGARAVELALQAERASGGKDPSILGTLAAAYAEAGRFSEAVAAAQRALDLASAQANTAQAETLRARLGLYQKGCPFRDAGLLPQHKTSPGN
jgi:tetratricopeptide (TPR) repeat protein